MIPTKTEIEGQRLGHAPVILHRISLNDAGNIGPGHGGVDAVAGDVAEQKVNQRGAGILPGKIECAVRIARLAEVIRPPPYIDAEFQVMLSPLVRKIIDKLVDAVGAVAWTDVTYVGKQLMGPSGPTDRDVGAAEEVGIGEEKGICIRPLEMLYFGLLVVPKVSNSWKFWCP